MSRGEGEMLAGNCGRYFIHNQKSYNYELANHKCTYFPFYFVSI